jgi:hypothetical protein
MMGWRALALVVGAAMLCACSEDAAIPGEAAPPDPPPPPPEEECAPGERTREDGSCQPAGMSADDCDPGFEHDGDVGCRAVLPSEACAAGLMAVPGDSQCREVAPCGDPPWGDAPADVDTQYVDGSYAGGDSDGSNAKPWLTITAALNAAAADAAVVIAEGRYDESLAVGAPVQIWGRCPALVEIAGTSGVASVAFSAGASGSELHAVGVTGSVQGVAVDGADVLVDRVWIHDNDDEGIAARAGARFHLRGSLIDGARHLSAFVSGATLTVEASQLRDTVPDPNDPLTGAGIVLQPDAAQTPSRGELVGSLIEGHHLTALFAIGAEVDVSGSVLRDTRAALADDTFGVAMALQAVPLGGAPSSAQVRGSLIERNTAAGIFMIGSAATVERSVIRDTATQPSDDSSGEGVHVQPDGNNRGSLTLTRSLVEASHTSGIGALGSDVVLNASVVRGTLPNAAGLDGIGVGALEAPGQGSTLSIEDSVIENVYEAGVFVELSTLTMRHTRVERVHPQQSDGAAGFCVNVQNVSGAPPEALVERSSISDCASFGLIASGSQLSANNVTIADVGPTAEGGLFGDGISVMSFEVPGSATLTGLTISGSERAGISSFGASVSLADSLFECNGIDLAAQSFETIPFSFQDGGNNVCQCGETVGTCRLQQSELQPPSRPE